MIFWFFENQKLLCIEKFSLHQINPPQDAIKNCLILKKLTQFTEIILNPSGEFIRKNENWSIDFMNQFDKYWHMNEEWNARYDQMFDHFRVIYSIDFDPGQIKDPLVLSYNLHPNDNQLENSRAILSRLP